jgi:hypothetical protein
VTVKPDAVATVRAFVTLPAAAWHGAAGYRIEVADSAGVRAGTRLDFAGPPR